MFDSVVDSIVVLEQITGKSQDVSYIAANHQSSHPVCDIQAVLATCACKVHDDWAGSLQELQGRVAMLRCRSALIKPEDRSYTLKKWLKQEKADV